MPVRDPSTAVLADAEVAEDKRYCARCGEPVGRGRNGRPGRPEGFCAKCGNRYSFTPKLKRGDLVGHQYEVMGCLAHGGLGWIYLARDRNVSNRWVVLKGLVDSGDDDALAAAMAERRFLAEVEHPNIVKIYNFVQHKGAGYTVMEYVGGTSLRDILKQRRGANNAKPDPVPVALAIAYMLEVLPALGYLHRLGLLFCDFKPDNVIQQDDALKLIDLGGVRRIDDAMSAIYGTVGFQAPEIADAGPSVASDLFTVGRTLAVLTIDFKGYQSTFRYSLPAPADVPLFARHESLHRFLCKATAATSDDRFQSADEMADQLVGVLREVVASEDGLPRPAASTLFSPDLYPRPEAPDWHLLPSLLVASDDPGAAFLASLTATDPAEVVAGLQAHLMVEQSGAGSGTRGGIAAATGTSELSREVQLRLARAFIEAGDCAAAPRVLDEIEAVDRWDWRVGWYRGLEALSAREYPAARAAFDRVWSEVPGELAPKLAAGVAAEYAGDLAAAGHLYDIVSRTDPGFTTASFGLARCRLAAGDRAGAVEAYNRVADASRAYLDAQIGAARALVDVGRGTAPGIAELTEASTAVSRLSLDGEQRANLARDLLQAALHLLRTGAVRPDTRVQVLGEPLTERRLRLGLERSYRVLARLAPTRDERVKLVDMANQARPRTLW